MPEKFHQYDLIKTLSKKYSHTTYLASPTNDPERQVVLTVFPASLFRFPHERENLLQKSQRLKKLQHEHLLSILDIGIEEEQPFVVREYLPNGSLRSHLKKISPDRMDLRDALTIVLQVGKALAYAHGHDLVHGNIKPENILFDANERIVLTDFNLMDRKDAIIRDRIAEEYAFCYMASEQFAGTCDAKSDQYALGCLAYELITGRVPFAAQSLASMMGQPSNNGPAPFSESVADLPPSLETAVLKTLAKDPDERFFDFSLFLEVIQAVLSPLPTFPLLRFTNSHKNRTISHPIQSAQDVSSSTRKRAAKDTTPQSLEPSAASSSVEVDVAEPMNTAPISQASMPEWAGIIPVSESLESALEAYQFPFSLSGKVDPIGDRENEEEVDDLLVADAFMRKKADAAAEETLPLKSPNIGGSQSVRPLHNRRKVLGLAVLFSVIVAVVISAFWLSRISTPDTSSHTTKRIIQAATIQTTIVPIKQPSVQATNMPTVQPSVQVMNTPVAQPPSPIPAPVVIPTPTPTPTPAINYDASDSRNTLSGGARLVNCSSCPNGYRVGYIGLNANVVGTLQFNNVSKNVAGKYTLTIYYIIAGSDKLTMYISVNGGPAVVLNVPAMPNGDTVGTASITVSLNAGNNTIQFSNPSVPAPDMDRIVV